MAAPGAACSVQYLWPLVTKAVCLEPKNTFVVPKRAPFLKMRHGKYLSRTKAEEAIAQAASTAARKPSDSLLSELDCVSLADRVVRRAKERLEKRQKKLPVTMSGPYGCEKELLVPIAHDKSNENSRALQSNTTESCLWRKVDAPEDARRQRVKSEAHSRLMTISSDVPNAPPVTPRGDSKQKFAHVPSLHDVKSLKQLKNRLEEIGTAMQADAAHTVKVERDKKLAEIKAQQRAEIYALNKYMTQFEEQNFITEVAGKV